MSTALPADRFWSILIREDVPLLLPPPADFIGQPLTFHYQAADHYRAAGAFRKRPLRPTDAPYALVDAPTSTWVQGNSGAQRAFEARRAVMTQIVRLVGGPLTAEQVQRLKESQDREQLDRAWRDVMAQKRRPRQVGPLRRSLRSGPHQPRHRREGRSLL